MAVSGLAPLAVSAPVPVYAVAGKDGLLAVEDLSIDPAISLQATPRHAGMLVVSGEIREDDHQALRRLHDQLPHPRATIWWRTSPVPGFPKAKTIEADLANAVHAFWGRLRSGEQSSEDDLLPNEPPAPWRGKGDHGQGGEGMMGGKPYGRPMAMTDDDRRDGLALDAYSASFGPFLSVLPPGLQLDLTLQGDVIQSAEVHRPPLAQAGADEPSRRIARLLRVLGLAALAERFLRTTQAGTGSLEARDRLLRWSGALRAIPQGLGEVSGEDARARLRRWCDQARGAAALEPVADGRLADMLPGLEWNEAILLINSFGHETLLNLCALEQRNAGRDGRA